VTAPAMAVMMATTTRVCHRLARNPRSAGIVGDKGLKPLVTTIRVRKINRFSITSKNNDDTP
jgi:hypothetical protein